MTFQSARGNSAEAPMRNAPCPCGSGEKYKRCCGAAGTPSARTSAPPSIDSLIAQGNKLLRAGQAEAALTPLLAAIESGATHFEVYALLGTALLNAGRVAEAAAILTHTITLRPDSATAQRDLGTALDRQGQHEPAMQAYAAALALDPKLTDTQLRLAQLYAAASRLEEAAACFDRVADARPNTALGHMCRSDAHLLRGDLPQAEHSVRRALAIAPKEPAALGGLAALLYNQGKFTEAATHFDQALRINPKSDKAWDGLVHCRKFTAADSPFIDRLRTTLRRDDLTDAERGSLHFSLGKIYDDCGEYGHAMQNFDAGNRLRAQYLNFDRAALAAQVDRAIACFTPQLLAQSTSLAAASEKPLFIVGMYRSGTTLLEQILSSHPGIAAGGELTIWGQSDLEIPQGETQPNPARFQTAAETYLARLNQISPNAARVTDKLPPNFLRLGAIHMLFPQARIIHCKRDPIDTCLSIYTNQFNASLSFAARKSDLVFYYQQYQRMMAHWRSVLPAKIFLEIDYEHLIADRAVQTSRLIDFIGLPWDSACLRPEENPRPITTASAWQARQPVYASSLQRWRRYQPWLGELRQLQNT